MYLKKSLVIAGLALATLLAGCATPLPAPKSQQSSMAIIEPIVSGKMRVGLNFMTYAYFPNPHHVAAMNELNRVICPDVKNTKTGDVTKAYGIESDNNIEQCYYPNLAAGTYDFQDYKFDGPGETYHVTFLTFYRSLLFRHHELQFSIGSGQVKHLGKYVIYFKQSGSDAAIEHIIKVDPRESIKQAKLDLAEGKSRWKLK